MIAAIDISLDDQSLVHQLKHACATSGCFYIYNHGICDSEIAALLNKMSLFFALDAKIKSKLVPASPFDDRGYNAFGSGNVAAFMGRQGEPNDPVEKFSIGNPVESTDVHWKPNVWPEEHVLPGFRTCLEHYFWSMKELSKRIFRMFALALELDESFFLSLTDTAPDSVKLNYYPKINGSVDTGVKRFAEHTDSVPFTILLMDNTKDSLRVKTSDSGLWVSVDPVPGSLFVNLGDVLQRWTNDLWVATPHYVQITRETKQMNRKSVAFFVMLNGDALIQCFPSCVGNESKYVPILYKDFVQDKMKRLVNPEGV